MSSTLPPSPPPFGPHLGPELGVEGNVMETTVKQREACFTHETLMIHVFRVPLPLRAQHSRVTKQGATKSWRTLVQCPDPRSRHHPFPRWHLHYPRGPNSPEWRLPPAAPRRVSECLLLQCSSEEDKQLAAFCKPKVGGVQRGGEHMFQLSHLQEGLSPTRRREEGGLAV